LWKQYVKRFIPYIVGLVNNFILKCIIFCNGGMQVWDVFQ